MDARRDRQVWANTYRRRLTVENLFAVQEEITKRIAQELQTRLNPREHEQIENRPTRIPRPASDGQSPSPGLTVCHDLARCVKCHPLELVRRAGRTSHGLGTRSAVRVGLTGSRVKTKILLQVSKDCKPSGRHT